MLAQKFRERAERCLRQAHEATLSEDKIMFLDMAETWLRLAQRDDAKEAQQTFSEGETGVDDPTSRK